MTATCKFIGPGVLTVTAGSIVPMTVDRRAALVGSVGCRLLHCSDDVDLRALNLIVVVAVTLWRQLERLCCNVSKSVIP